MIETIKYMVKNWIGREKRSLFRVQGIVLLPILIAYIPKVMIDCIQQMATY